MITNDTTGVDIFACPVLTKLHRAFLIGEDFRSFKNFGSLVTIRNLATLEIFPVKPSPHLVAIGSSARCILSEL